MGNLSDLASGSQEEEKAGLLKIAREIESAVSTALMRRSSFSAGLLDEVLELYPLDRGLTEKVRKVKGRRLHHLRLDLFQLFAKTGKRTSRRRLPE